MKRESVITIFTALIFILVFAVNHFFINPKDFNEKLLKVGFLYDGDESIPYANNFFRSQYMAQELFAGRVEFIVKSNVTPDKTDDVLEELVQEGCTLIFTTSYSHAIIAKEFAEKYPDVQFCQSCGDNANEAPVLKNYHTFMGEIHQGRYVSGIVAGMKIKQLIEDGVITEDEAKIGYVGAYPYNSVISGYTAFLLGARSIVPSIKMTVVYTYTWSSFSDEKACAKHLIDEGCVVISQHSDTSGPAIACEESFEKPVFHIAYNQSMVDIAPMTSLSGCRINWTPYITGAIKAVLENKVIEKSIKGHVHGNDIGAGFDLDWVQMLEVNHKPAAPGTEEKVRAAVQAFKKGKVSVFQGDYIGVNTNDENEIYDLRKEYKECANASAPSFCYILKDVITIDELSLFDD